MSLNEEELCISQELWECLNTGAEDFESFHNLYMFTPTPEEEEIGFDFLNSKSPLEEDAIEGDSLNCAEDFKSIHNLYMFTSTLEEGEKEVDLFNFKSPLEEDAIEGDSLNCAEDFESIHNLYMFTSTLEEGEKEVDLFNSKFPLEEDAIEEDSLNFTPALGEEEIGFDFLNGEESYERIDKLYKFVFNTEEGGNSTESWNIESAVEERDNNNNHQTYVNADVTNDSDMENWYGIDCYFRTYQNKIRLERGLFENAIIPTRYLQFEAKIYNVFFSLKESGGFSEDEIMLALEMSSRLLMSKFISKWESICKLEELIQFRSDHWEHEFQTFTNENLTDLLICLLLAKKFFQGKSELCTTIIHNLLEVSGKEINISEICFEEMKILDFFNQNLSLPLTHTYCHILFEVVGGFQFGITRQIFYSSCFEVLKFYYLNKKTITEKMYRFQHQINKELISAGILCTVFYQCSMDENRYIPDKIINRLEKLLQLNKSDILHFSLLIIDKIN